MLSGLHGAQREGERDSKETDHAAGSSARVGQNSERGDDRN